MKNPCRIFPPPTRYLSINTTSQPLSDFEAVLHEFRRSQQVSGPNNLFVDTKILFELLFPFLLMATRILMIKALA